MRGLAKVVISLKFSWKIVRYEEERHGGDKVYLTRFMSMVLATTTDETWLGKQLGLGGCGQSGLAPNPT